MTVPPKKKEDGRTIALMTDRISLRGGLGKYDSEKGGGQNCLSPSLKDVRSYSAKEKKEKKGLHSPASIEAPSR